MVVGSFEGVATRVRVVAIVGNLPHLHRGNHLPVKDEKCMKDAVKDVLIAMSYFRMRNF